MQLFYTQNIEENSAFFDKEEARHCVQVLRKRAGDPICFVDGLGGFYKGEIIEAKKAQVVVSILEKTIQQRNRNYHLHIGIAPTKNIDRFEWFLEKATEIGIDEITPLLCEHSERKRIRPERLNKILLSAMKQSLSAFLPKLNEFVEYQDFINNDCQVFAKFIGYCGVDLPHLKSIVKPSKNILVLIGPEGDFSPDEFKAAMDSGFRGISLGRRRLRTETAGIVTAAMVNFLN